MSSEPDSAAFIVRTGTDGRLRYGPQQRDALLDAFASSGQSALAFARQHGVKYQTFISWLRKRRECGAALPQDTPGFRRGSVGSRRSARRVFGASPHAALRHVRRYPIACRFAARARTASSPAPPMLILSGSLRVFLALEP